MGTVDFRRPITSARLGKRSRFDKDTNGATAPPLPKKTARPKLNGGRLCEKESKKKKKNKEEEEEEEEEEGGIDLSDER